MEIFSQSVKNELCRVYSSRDCCKRAEAAAFLLYGGGIRMDSSGISSLFINTEHARAARKMFLLFKDLFNPRMEIKVRRKDRLRKNQVYTLEIMPEGGAEETINALGFTPKGFSDTGPLLNPLVWENSCCMRACLRGAFLAAGSITSPKGAYHLEIVCEDYAEAHFLIELARRFEVAGRAAVRRKGMVFYLKEADSIITFLNVVGSHRALMELESIRIEKGVRNQVNRMVNSEAANIVKQVDAAQRQIENIRKIQKSVGLSALTEPLMQAALARMAYPELTLSDLGDIMGLSKSAVNHRLRRIAEIADGIC